MLCSLVCMVVVAVIYFNLRSVLKEYHLVFVVNLNGDINGGVVE